jgi:hypothetical protein
MNPPDLDPAERHHLLRRIDELDRARRRWKVLALAGTPVLAVLLVLAVANAVSSSLTLRDVALRGRQARDDALRAAEEARDEAERSRAVAHQALQQAGAALQGQQAAEPKAPHGKPIALSLEVVEREIRAGTAPKFRLTLKNTSEGAEKVLDVRSRAGLQDTYFDLEVTQDGKPVRVPRAISDPGPIDDKSFLSLPPGDSVTFVLSAFATALEELPPGSYQASVRFWQDPYQGRETSYKSPEATFSVRK